MAKPRILIIEDERGLTDVLSYNLNREGYETLVAHDGQEGLRKAQMQLPDLDPARHDAARHRRSRSVPGTAGRQADRDIPILMLTAKSEETDQIVGFTMGADDYVTKPFSVKVLLQRIRALQAPHRHGRGERAMSSSTSASSSTRSSTVRPSNGAELDLTPTEFRLLECLLRQPGRAFTRTQLMDSAIDEGALVLERTIDVHIKSLRRKLGPAGDFIETVRGVGYRFREMT